ncbi:MAG: hypothetical protein RLZZ455_766 [Candidatus Parcubacteria bacterium]
MRLSAQERTRTSTLLTALAPEASVYTISPPGLMNEQIVTEATKLDNEVPICEY